MILASLLQHPRRIAALTDREWDVVIPQARCAGLLSRLATVAQAEDGYAALAERPLRHMQAAQLVSAKHRNDVLYELDRIYEILGPLLGTIVLLKGAAYLAADLPSSRGRIFNDIDILVPEEKLDAVEALLKLAGWQAGEIEPYDDRYYRRWMHQIPPLTHGGRQTTIDVHHNIVPRTARIGAVSAARLIEHATTLPTRPGFAVLAPEDMVLHSATHLFNEGEFDRGLRDLSDLDLLIRQFGPAVDFWPTLLSRAIELKLTRPLFYALRYASRIVGTPVPSEILAESRRFGPPAPVLMLMDSMLSQALAPNHKSCQGPMTGAALLLLFMRAHYLRMPLHLLIPHLVRKGIRRPANPGTKEPG